MQFEATSVHTAMELYTLNGMNEIQSAVVSFFDTLNGMNKIQSVAASFFEIVRF